MKGFFVIITISLFASSESLFLRNKNSQKILKATTESATQVEQYPADMSLSYVQRSLTGGDYGYEQVYNPNNNKCLTVFWDYYYEGKQNGAPVGWWECTDGAKNQHWRQVEETSSTSFQLINRNSDKCLTVSGWATNVGATIDQRECLWQANQLWNWYG